MKGSKLYHEVLHYMLKSKDNFHTVSHWIKPEQIADEGLSELFEELYHYQKMRKKLPTMAILEHRLKANKPALKHLAEVASVVKVDEEKLLPELEDLIRKMIFVADYDRVGQAFNKSRTKEKAYAIWKKSNEKLEAVSLARNRVSQVFGGFQKRTIKKKFEDRSERFLIPFGIDELDHYLRGMEEGNYTLVLGDTGVGKTTFLIHTAITATRYGHNALFFHAGDGKKDEVLDRFDASWTGYDYWAMRDFKNIPEDKYERWKRAVSKVTGEIYVEAIEGFEQRPNIRDIRALLVNFQKQGVPIGLVAVDYLELCDPMDTSWGNEEQRQAQVSRELKQIGVEFGCSVVSATQAKRINKELLNDPNFFISRDDIGESYSKIKPTDFFFTFNQTYDEKSKKILRIFVDKARFFESKFHIKIIQNLSKSRFYNSQATRRKFYK